MKTHRFGVNELIVLFFRLSRVDFGSKLFKQFSDVFLKFQTFLDFQSEKKCYDLITYTHSSNFTFNISPRSVSCVTIFSSKYLNHSI